jgi:glycerate kinase
MPGAGAAGGLGFGAMAFLGASVSSGAVAIMQLTGFEEVVQQSDLIITGEGRLDGQTAQGKLVSAICKVAKLSGVPVLAICGEVDADDAALAEIGLKAAYQIRRLDETLLASIARTPKALETLAYKVLKTIRL